MKVTAAMRRVEVAGRLAQAASGKAGTYHKRIGTGVGRVPAGIRAEDSHWR